VLSNGGCPQVLLGMEGEEGALHFAALCREVQLASRFSCPRLVQACHISCRPKCLNWN
jgi:hypothetical protein